MPTRRQRSRRTPDAGRQPRPVGSEDPSTGSEDPSTGSEDPSTGSEDRSAGIEGRRLGGGLGGPPPASFPLALALLLAFTGLVPGTSTAQERAGGEGDRAAVDAETAVLYGTIRFAASGKPAGRAELRIPGTGVSDVADADGNFRLEGIPPGDRTLVVRYLRDSAPEVEIRLEPGAEERIGIELYEKVVPVGELRVEVTAGEEGGRLAGFRQRRAEGRGDFYTRERIERVGGTRLSMVVRQSAGVNVTPCQGSGGVSDDCFRVSSSRGLGGQGRCSPTLWVDGARVSSDVLTQRFGLIRKGDVLAMEIYDGPSQTPQRFQSANSNGCGAIVIWTGPS